MMGIISVNESPELTLERLKDLPSYDDTDFVSRVTTAGVYGWDQPIPGTTPSGAGYRILVTDTGLKYNILRLLRTRGCEVIAFPASVSADELLERQPDGILMSPGPGDPELLDYVVETAKGIIGKVPIMGICLGNQVLARAFGGKTYKLKFGHRGGNHPVRDMETGRVHITAQNHGYAVDADSLPSDVEVSHINLNDGTVEGLRHRSLPIMSIQYHSEASPGPLDNEYLFDRFLSVVREFNT
jgi:carbamoyl-phosphate synthase small subunit